MQTILSFDYGYKKIGLAVGNSLLKTAQELSTVQSHKGTPDWVQLDKMIEQWRPDVLLIGLPLTMEGVETRLSKQAREFGKQLSNRYNLEIDYEDERLSSNEADKIMRETLTTKQGLSKKLQSKRDQIAARIILESYFARHA